MHTHNPTQPPKINDPKQRQMYAIIHPTGQISLRTIHSNPAITISRIEEDHVADWSDLQKQGYRLATITITVTQTHDNAYQAIHEYTKDLQP